MSDSEAASVAPLDVLDATVGEVVTVRLKSGQVYHGRLDGWDHHMNVTLSEIDATLTESSPSEQAGDTDGTVVIRGDTIVTITPGDPDTGTPSETEAVLAPASSDAADTSPFVF